MIEFITLFSLYITIVMLIAWYSSRISKSKDDWFLAGRKVGFWMGICTLLATLAGAVHFFGLVGYGYSYGIAGTWPGVFIAIGIPIFGLLLVSRARKQKFSTVADIIGDTYGKRVKKYCAIFYSLRSFVIVVVELIGIGLIFNFFLGVPYVIGVILAGAIIIIYSTIGGFHSIIRTDVIQLFGIILGLGSLMVIGLIYSDTSSLSSSDLNPFNIKFTFFISLALTCLPLAFTTPPLYDRVFAIKDRKTVKKALIVSGIILIIISLFPTIIGLTGRTILGKDVIPDVVSLLLIARFCSPWLSAIIGVSILAAIMSTCDSFLFSSVSLDALNLSNRWKYMDTIKISRVLIIITGCAGIVLAVIFQAVMFTFLLGMKIMVATLFIPTIAALYSSNITEKTILYSMSLGFLATIIWIILGNPYDIDSIVVGIGFSLFPIFLMVANRFKN